MKNTKVKILLLVIFFLGFSLGIFYKVIADYILPFSLGKIGDVASLVSALAAVLTLLLGFYVMGQWKDQSKYAEEVIILTELREHFRSYCVAWSSYVSKQFSEENLVRKLPFDFDFQREEFLRCRRNYDWFWHQVEAFSLMDKFDLIVISPKVMKEEFERRCSKSYGLTLDDAHEVRSSYDRYLDSVLHDGTVKINSALKELRK